MNYQNSNLDQILDKLVTFLFADITDRGTHFADQSLNDVNCLNDVTAV